MSQRTGPVLRRIPIADAPTTNPDYYGLQQWARRVAERYEQIRIDNALAKLGLPSAAAVALGHPAMTLRDEDVLSRYLLGAAVNAGLLASLHDCAASDALIEMDLARLGAMGVRAFTSGDNRDQHGQPRDHYKLMQPSDPGYQAGKREIDWQDAATSWSAKVNNYMPRNETDEATKVLFGWYEPNCVDATGRQVTFVWEPEGAAREIVQRIWTVEANTDPQVPRPRWHPCLDHAGARLQVGRYVMDLVRRSEMIEAARTCALRHATETQNTMLLAALGEGQPRDVDAAPEPSAPSTIYALRDLTVEDTRAVDLDDPIDALYFSPEPAL